MSGAYSLLMLTEGKLIAARDPHGFRPLVLGRLRDSYVFASETCCFDLIEAQFIREIEPGEVVIADGVAVRSFRPFEPAPQRFCVFEHVYFARPDSLLNGRSVYRARERMGRRLAVEHPAPADVVIPVPDSGVPAAIGYSQQSGIPLEMGLIRSHYVGRTFIEPQDSIRHFGVRLKLSPVRSVVDGKRIAVIDDSLVRGTTSRKIVNMLRGAGAAEVHLRISAPPTTHPCFYGIDTPTREELIASSHSNDEIAELHRLRLARLPVARRDDGGGQPVGQQLRRGAGQRLLLRLLHRRISCTRRCRRGGGHVRAPRRSAGAAAPAPEQRPQVNIMAPNDDIEDIDLKGIRSHLGELGEKLDELRGHL